MLELISFAYRGDEDFDDKTYSDSERNIGLLSLRFIKGHVKSCPGLTKNGTLDEDALMKYADEFMSLAKNISSVCGEENGVYRYISGG